MTTTPAPGDDADQQFLTTMGELYDQMFAKFRLAALETGISHGVTLVAVEKALGPNVRAQYERWLAGEPVILPKESP